jgi:hypothetical protein
MIGIAPVFARIPLSEIVEDIQYGADAGLSISRLKGPSEHASILGFIVGGTASYQFSPSGYLDAFLGLQQKGSDGNGGVLKLNYISLPITLRYALPARGTLHPFVYTGGYVSYTLSADFDGDDVSDNFQKNDFGWTYGVGFKMPLNPNELSVSVGYEVGLKAATGSLGKDAYNRSLILRGGLRF